jgi:N-acetylglucosaminyl-diphospho-decaprenol L-rhamnosyltransferase
MPSSVSASCNARGLSIVIVNWNTGPLLRECLSSIADAGMAQDWTLDRVVVVDNASSDDSASRLPAAGYPLEVLANNTNRGFAAACNQGAARCTSELLLFLNPDTRLFENSLRTPVAYLASPRHQDIGIVGIQLLDQQGSVSRSCARFPRWSHFAAQACGLDRLRPSLGHLMREWDHRSTREVDQVIGAFFLTRSRLFNDLGGFDERFFVYFEEVDYALRALQAGMRSVYLASAQAMHVGGGASNQVKGRRLFHSLHSRLLYGQKHFGRLQRGLLWAVSWFVEPLARAAQLVIGRRWAEFGELAEGYLLLLRTYHPRPGSPARS